MRVWILAGRAQPFASVKRQSRTMRKGPSLLANSQASRQPLMAAQ